MTSVEWEQYGDLCASHDQRGLDGSPELRAHLIEFHQNHNNERKAS